MVTSKPCFEYGEVVQWKGNFPNYFKELKKKRDAGQPSGTIFMIYIEINTFSSNTWVLDTVCRTHFYNLLQRFKRNRYIKREDISLFMGNYARVHVEAQGDYVLKLPNGLEVILRNI